MTRTLQICLMVLTGALCGVCLLQWYRENLVLERLREVSGELGVAREQAQFHAVLLEGREREVTRLNEALLALAATAAGTVQEGKDLEASLAGHAAAASALRDQLQQALAERDALASRLNARTREFNELATKYRKQQ